MQLNVHNVYFKT